MTDLIPIINEIIKYGLEPNLVEPHKEKLLERNLYNIYDMHFEISYEFDETEFQDFDKSIYSEVRRNVTSNFKDFGLYKIILDLDDLTKSMEVGIGDAIDDLSDIIIDLLEIKWRIENNSLEDGLWFFEIIFNSHTKQHLRNLLDCMKNKN